MSEERIIIEVIGVEKKYTRGNRSFTALTGVNLKIAEGDFVIVQGSSGAGKTTLLNLISGMDLPTEGKILVDKDNIVEMSEEKRAEIRRKKIGFVFQFFNLIDDLTVLENVMVPLLPSDESNRSIRIKAEEALDAVDMLGKKDKYPKELSGGEQQRVAIARALVSQPDIIIADEPTAQLDEENAKKIIDILKRLNLDSGVTIILATASEMVADMFSDLATKIIKLEKGRILEVKEKVR
ncbi:MAG: ABC transporter ATP-binding protein [Candidatus Njordarchaeia archaeon]